MSIWSSTLIFDDQWDGLQSPIVYRGSHVFPSVDDGRGGYIDLAEVSPDLTCLPYLRVSMRGIEPEGDTTVLDADQVRALRDALTEWLERVEAT